MASSSSQESSLPVAKDAAEPSVQVVDARGMACPMPIAMLARAIRPLPGGARVRLLATDAAVVADLQAWSAATGHLLKAVAPREGVWMALIEKRRP